MSNFFGHHHYRASSPVEVGVVLGIGAVCAVGYAIGNLAGPAIEWVRRKVHVSRLEHREHQREKTLSRSPHLADGLRQHREGMGPVLVQATGLGRPPAAKLNTDAANKAEATTAKTHLAPTPQPAPPPSATLHVDNTQDLGALVNSLIEGAVRSSAPSGTHSASYTVRNVYIRVNA